MFEQKSLFKKLITLFISLIIPVLIIGTYSVQQSNTQLQHQVLNSIAVNNQTYIQQLDTTLQQIYLSNNDILHQSFANKLSYISHTLSPYDRSVYIKLLREQLSNLCNTYPFIESAHLFFKIPQIIYSSPGYKLGSFQEIDSEYLTLLSQLNEDSQVIHYYYHPKIKQHELSLLLYPSISNRDYGLILTLSQHELIKYLNTNVSYRNDYYLLKLNDASTLTNLSTELTLEAELLLEELAPLGNSYTYQKVTLDGISYYMFVHQMPFSHGLYIRFIPATNLLESSYISNSLIILLFIIVISSCVAFFIVVKKIVHKPLIQLIDAFKKVEKGNFEVQITESHIPDFSYIYFAFNNMTLQLKSLIEKSYNQKILLQKAELKQLQAQINPHFLYNSFFMLQRMLKLGLTEEALEISNALGIYFRYITKNNMDYVTLEEEYEHAKTYAYIQGLRFEGRIEVLFAPPPEAYQQLMVPKLILQPILENAFNYGLNDTLSDGLLKIYFVHTLDLLQIIIEENGENLSEAKLNELKSNLEIAKNSSAEIEMTGILNIQRRLVVFSNHLSSLAVSRSSLGGLCVTVTLSTTAYQSDLTI